METSKFHPKFYGSHKEFSDNDERYTGADTHPPDSITDLDSWRGEVGKTGKGMVRAWVHACLCVCRAGREVSLPQCFLTLAAH